MNVKDHYDKNKQLYWIFGLLLAGFFITGTILFLNWYKKRQEGRMKSKGIQQSTLDFVSKEEGRKYLSYKDIVGIDTVGVGHKILPGEEHLLGKKITDAEIDTLLRKDLQIASDAITKNVNRPLSQNQFNALISLVFNIGAGAFKSSTLLKYLNDGTKSKEDISSAWRAWKKAGGVEQPALVARRQREINLFFQ